MYCLIFPYACYFGQLHDKNGLFLYLHEHDLHVHVVCDPVAGCVCSLPLQHVI